MEKEVTGRSVRSHYLAVFLTIILLSVTLAGCTDNDDDDDDDGNGEDVITITINGMKLTFKALFDNQTTVTITTDKGDNFTGILLSDLINLSGLASPEDHQYAITATDGYSRNITWDDAMIGVLAEHDEDDTTTAFPNLPGKYRIRSVASIEPVTTPTIEVNDWLYTWDQPFHKFDEKTLQNETENHTGVSLSDLVNDTGLGEQNQYNFTIIASDGYSKNVTWNDMTNGILVKDERKSIFLEKEKKYWIKDIVRIEVV